MKYLQIIYIIFLIACFSCKGSINAPFIGEVSLSTESDYLYIYNETAVRIYYRAVKEYESAMTSIRIRPVETDDYIDSRQSKRLNLSTIEVSQLDTLEPGDTVVVYWWTSHEFGTGHSYSVKIVL